MNHLNSHLGRVIEAFNILVPQEPLDAKTLSELIDLTPKQTSQCLSILHRTGYLAKVGANNRYACFVVKKPLKARAVSVRRAYKNRLIKQKQRNYKDVERHIASKIAQAAIRGIVTALNRQTRMIVSTDASTQLPLFGLEKRSRS